MSTVAQHTTSNQVWVTKFAELRQAYPQADVIELIWATDEACHQPSIEDRLQAGIERSQARQAENATILTDEEMEREWQAMKEQDDMFADWRM